MTNTNNFNGPVEQFNQVEGSGNTFNQNKGTQNINYGTQNGVNQNSGTQNNVNQNSGTQTINQNPLDFGDLGKLAKAVQSGILDPKKLASLKRELTALSKTKDVPLTVRMKMAPLITALEAIDTSALEANPKLWEILRPYIGDAANLSTMASLLGEYGGTVLGILRKIFLPGLPG